MYRIFYAGFYDVAFQWMVRPRIRAAVEEMGIRPGQTVLDLGIGTGLSLPFFPEGTRVAGVDLNAEMLKKAEEKARENGRIRTSLFRMDGQRLGFKDASFDHALLAFVVTVVPDPVALLRETQRVVRPGGSIVILNHFLSRHKFVAGLERLARPICKRLGWHSDLEIEPVLERSGLRILREQKIGRTRYWRILHVEPDRPGNNGRAHDA
mgnify:CR=1 FL=1